MDLKVLDEDLMNEEEKGKEFGEVKRVVNAGRWRI